MFGRSRRGYSTPLERSISSALTQGCEPGTPTSLACMSVDQRLIDELAQLGAQRVGARRDQLGGEGGGDALRRADPEARAGQAAPRQLPRRAGVLGLARIEDDREAQAEAHAVVLGLGDRRARDRLELGPARQV